MKSLMIAAACLLCSTSAAAQIKHKFVATDESGRQLIYVDENNPRSNWAVPVRARDMQLVGNNRVLVSVGNGYREYDLSNGKMVKEVKKFKGVPSVRRLSNGHTLVVSQGKTIELDASDEEVRKIPVGTGRIMRITRDSTLLICAGEQVREYDVTGKQVLSVPIPGGKKSYKAMLTPSGNFLAASGMNCAVVEIDRTGKHVRTFGGKDKHGNIALKFFADFNLLPNGNVVVCSWLGHGRQNSKAGPQLLEFDRNNNLVWKWHDPGFAGCLHGLIILDGLDTTKMHDERNGVLAPAQASGRKGGRSRRR